MGGRRLVGFCKAVERRSAQCGLQFQSKILARSVSPTRVIQHALPKMEHGRSLCRPATNVVTSAGLIVIRN